MRSPLAPILLSLALAAGCVTTEYRSTIAAKVPTPDLVAVAPGVQIIANYDEPILFSEGSYWWLVDGGWYRSTSYLSGWVYIATPPVAVVRIHEPHHYRYYQPPGYIARHRPVAVYHVQRPIRDHRSDASRVRDHRR
jgi:hypothetical protein